MMLTTYCETRSCELECLISTCELRPRGISFPAGLALTVNTTPPEQQFEDQLGIRSMRP